MDENLRFSFGKQTLNCLILLFSLENHCSIEFLIPNRNLGSYNFLSLGTSLAMYHCTISINSRIVLARLFYLLHKNLG
ncbi:MAG: hypothetical protein ACP5HX_05660, partial [Thermoproteota archaeon]